ncbi:methyltransferase [Nonomuraea africana]|uniref:8-O-methyltransferase n=1 Tax=Nonomuraea africana TaxID=46171 RepID=A0ABR9KIL2_9ACTN|nr:methyltransferase [Nonomuraea africana]MBE1561864.1 8-O-methyltransferase [Nonomuraea africana]
MSLPESALPIVRTATGFFQAQALFVGIELGLFARVSREPADAATLQQEFGLHPSLVHDYLDALVAMDLLARDGSQYRATPMTSTYLDPTKPEYIGGFLAFNQRRLYPAWGTLGTFLRSGENLAQKFSAEGDFTSELYADPRRARAFTEAMDGYAVLLARPLAEKFRWDEVKSFADLGGCRGLLTARIAAAHPHLRGVTFDLPPLEPLFDELIDSVGGDTDLRDRVSYQAGSFFTDALPDTQVYIFGHVLHDWVDERRRELVRRAFEQLPPGGTLLVYDSMIDDERRDAVFNLLMSLNMAMISGSSEYTVSQGIGWLEEAGFTVEEPVALNEITTLLVANKPL